VSRGAQLSRGQIENLHADIVDKFSNHPWPDLEPGQLERTVTKNIVAPIVRTYLDNIGASTLVLRHDGQLQPRPLIRHGMSFAPDLDISRLNQRCLAIEVKILRSTDASGSLTKAIGQTFSYKALGYESSIGLIFEGRGRRYSNLQEELSQMSKYEKLIQFIYIS
jgi:hypothetical protein